MKRVSEADLARLGERLRAVREDGGLSQKDVATRLKISEVGYGHFERGRRLPSAAELPWLAHGLGVSTEELLTRLGLIDQKLFEAPVPEAIAGRLTRIVANWDLLNTAEKTHVAAILALAGDFSRSESDTMGHPDTQSDTSLQRHYGETGGHPGLAAQGPGNPGERRERRELHKDPLTARALTPV